MVRRALPIAVLLAGLCAHAQGYDDADDMPAHVPGPWAAMYVPSSVDPHMATPSVGAWFEFAPESGAGLPVAQTLCSQLSAAEVASGWCLNGDGTMAAGSSTTLVAQGAPTDGTSTVCPNGPTCGSEDARRYTATSWHAPAADAALPASDWTYCEVLSVESAGYTAIFGSSVGSFATFSVAIGLSSAAGPTVYISDGAAASSVAVSALTFGTTHLFCVTYERVGGAADNVVRTYTDGTAGATSSAQKLAAALESSWKTNGGGGGGGAAERMFGAFFLPSELSSTRIAAIARAVLADSPTGAKGEAVTYTRTGPRFCDSVADGTAGSAGSILPANRPCVTRSGLLSESARTNLMVRSAEFDNVAWSSGATGVAAPTLTANAAVAPDGTMTAERMEVPLTTAGQYSYRYQALAGAAAHSWGVYVRGNGTSGTMHLWGGNTPNACVLCAYNATTWTRCALSHGAATPTMGFGNDSTNAACVTAGAVASALDVFVWGAQAEAGAKASSYVPTTSAAVARGADAPSTDASAWPIDATGCFGATVSSAAGGAGLAGALLVDSQVAATSGALLSVASATSVQMEDAPATAVATLSGLTFSASTDYRVWGGWDGTNWTVAQDATTATTASALGSGAHSNATEFCSPPTSGSYLCSKVMADPDPSRCR